MGASRHILLVEDVDLLRTSLAELLTDEGFQVSTAIRGIAALDFIRDAKDQPVVALVDYVPERPQTRAFLGAAERAKVPVVLLAAAALATPPPHRNILAMLQMPFDVQLLIRLCRDLSDGLGVTPL